MLKPHTVSRKQLTLDWFIIAGATGIDVFFCGMTGGRVLVCDNEHWSGSSFTQEPYPTRWAVYDDLDLAIMATIMKGV